MKSNAANNRIALVWFRSDLRSEDSPALYHASQECGKVIGVYLTTPEQWAKHQIGANRQWFTLQHVSSLREDLAKLGIPLLVRNSGTFKSCAPLLVDLCREFSVTDVFFNGELEVNELERDSSCKAALENHSIGCHKYHDQTLALPGKVKTQNGHFYKVYTPFKKAFIETIASRDIDPLPQPPKIANNLTINPQQLGDIPEIAPACHGKWKIGQAHASTRLKAFVENSISDYNSLRDLPALAGTSGLSPYLAVGAISTRQCFYEAFKANSYRCQSDDAGITNWINELIWREFYKHLVVGFPHVCKHQPLNTEYTHIPWRDSEADFGAWCRGETGYPIVDAAIKQLLQTGWMHNRLRMVTAMFLTKHLLIEWRKGESFFLQHLIDADFAANNGGWQWSASTGADAAPYFRIFNPVRQSERFDAEGKFIKRFLPELENLSHKSIHLPTPLEAKAVGYPLPMVDHRFAVERAKQTFRTSREQYAYSMEQAI